MSNDQVCNAEGMTDEEATSMACEAEQNSLDNCESCSTGDCPDANGPIEAATQEAGPPPDGVTLASGTSKLIDVFVADTGIMIVLSDTVEVVDRTGHVLESVPDTRTITSAAFDGTTLAVADETTLTTYSTSLVPRSTTALSGQCTFLAMVSGTRVVCSQAIDSADMSLVVYGSGTSVASQVATEPDYALFFTRIQGTDDIVTDDEDLDTRTLLRVDPSTSEVSVVGTTAAGSKPGWIGVLAFEGSPATLMVTASGALANIYAQTCSETMKPSTCFTPDGQLFSLPSGESFVGLDGDDGTGIIEGLVGSPGPTSEDVCVVGGGCIVEQVSLSQGTVLSTKSYPLSILSVIAARGDAKGAGLVVGYTMQSLPGNTYRVALLPY
jgi:hypothetical protein